PSSQVLNCNCQGYFFSEYAAGMLQDTSCTSDQGDYGCDNCVGDFRRYPSSHGRFCHARLGAIHDRLWTVPQGFQSWGSWVQVRRVLLLRPLGWSRPDNGRVSPTGAEFLVEIIVAIDLNAGARDFVSWVDPTRPDHTRCQGQCVRICACQSAARPSPLSCYPLRCISQLSTSRVLSRPIGSTLACGPLRTAENAYCHGHQLEQFHSERHAQ
ncbi:hypothetical protein F5888DRAFT_1612743, partial [Russula emetica]